MPDAREILVIEGELDEGDVLVQTHRDTAVLYRAPDDDGQGRTAMLMACKCTQWGWKCAGDFCFEQCVKWECEEVNKLPPIRRQ